MSNDSHLFLTQGQLEEAGWKLIGNHFYKGSEEYIPLYEGRFGHQFNHRYASQPSGNLTETYLDGLADPQHSVTPQYWVNLTDAENYFSGRSPLCKTALLGFRRVSRNTDERTAIAAVIPWGAASYGWILTFGLDAYSLGSMCAVFNSFIFDYLLRSFLSQPSIPQGTFQQVASIHPKSFFRSLLHNQPGIPTNFVSNIFQDVFIRVIELVFTAWDLEGYAKDCKYIGPPFLWNEERRFQLRAELDAAFFHLYLRSNERGDWVSARNTDACPHDETPDQLAELKKHFPTPRNAVAHIMDTFPIVRRKDEEKYKGDYRTKRVILEIFDAMQEAIRTGKPYQTQLDPPPGPPTNPDGSFASLPDWQPGTPKPANWPSHIHPPRGCHESH